MCIASVEARRAPALAALRRFPTVTAAAPPSWATRGGTGTRARGFGYERKVGNVLRAACCKHGWELIDHQWFVYKCGTETKYFQPDFVIDRPGDLGIVVEVKLTYIDTNAQLRKYLEYLKIFGLVCFPLTVVRNLTPFAEKDLLIDDITKARANAVWHLWV